MHITLDTVKAIMEERTRSYRRNPHRRVKDES